MNSFLESKRLGKEGELTIKRWLTSLGYSIEDVSEDPEYQSKDIDFIINGSISVEVKTDYVMNRTGNVCVELLKHTAKGTHPGWFGICEADYILYYDAIYSIVYKLNTKMLQKAVREGKGTHRIFNAQGESKGTEARLFTVQELRDYKVLDKSMVVQYNER